MWIRCRLPKMDISSEAQCLGNESQRMLTRKEHEVRTEVMASHNASTDDDGCNDVLEPLETRSNTYSFPLFEDDSDIEDVNEVVGAEDTGDGGDMSSDVPNEEVMVRREAILLQPRKAMSSGRVPYTVLKETVNSDEDGLANTLLTDSEETTRHFVNYYKRDDKTLKIWECGICQKHFTHQYSLMSHLPIHTNERNFKCETCGKEFRQLSTLSQHRAIHTNARSYVCEICKKDFNRVSILILHRKTHSDKKAHICNVCGKGFHQKFNLRNHILTHSNERPYKCEVCGKGFNQRSNLVCHQKKKHGQGDKPHYSCNICKIAFHTIQALQTHEQYSHGMKHTGDTVIEGKMDSSQNPGPSK